MSCRWVRGFTRVLVCNVAEAKVWRLGRAVAGVVGKLARGQLRDEQFVGCMETLPTRPFEAELLDIFRAWKVPQAICCKT